MTHDLYKLHQKIGNARGGNESLLTCIFHTDHLRKPGSKGGCCVELEVLPHQPSQLPRYDQYGISALGYFVQNKCCYFLGCRRGSQN